MEYRGVKIELIESTGFSQVTPDGSQDYVVKTKDRMQFCAHTRYGTAYALQSDAALTLAKDLIDRKLAS